MVKGKRLQKTEWKRNQQMSAMLTFYKVIEKLLLRFVSLGLVFCFMLWQRYAKEKGEESQSGGCWSFRM